MKPFRVKFFQRKPAKVDPRSRELTDALVANLFKHGMTDKEKQAKCALEMLNAMVDYFKRITRGKQVDTEIQELVTKMKQSLTTYGVVDDLDKEEIILDSMAEFNKKAMGNENN